MLTALLPPRLRPAAKAFYAAAAPLLVLVVHGVITGEWSQSALEAAVTSLVTGLLVYRVPNA